MSRHQNSVATAVIVVFVASAVFGLCAMAMGSTDGHGDMACPQSGISMMVCAGNQIRHALTDSGILGVSLVLVLVMLGFVATVIPDAVAPPSLHEHMAPLELPASVLQEAFSAGILQPKLFA